MNQTIKHLEQAISQSFQQLENCLISLSEAEYTTASKALFGATIGQHVRHIIELFTELDKGYAAGVVNYDNRTRDYAIETNKGIGIQLLQSILDQLDKPAKNLVLQAIYLKENNEQVEIKTSYSRELAYNLEHTIHHMALIRVGIADVSQVQVQQDFGIASSTIKYRQACAQ